MSLFFRQETEPPLDRRQSLEGVPVLNARVTTQPGEGGQTLVSMPLQQRRRGFLGRFGPQAALRRIQLDELGSFVIGLVDGRATVREIIDAFVERYKTTRREAELSVVEFLKSLAERSVISIVVK